MRLDWATADDAEALAAAHAFGFPHRWDAKAFADLFDGPGVFGLMIRDGEDLAGMALCRTVLGEMEVLTIAVDPQRRRRGLARALMTAALGAAREAGAEACFLEVAADNAAAEALYRALGFRDAGLRRAYYDRGPAGRVDARVMRLDLTSDAA
ncbi:GNAT family N-acetyltransferase [Phenylobacterium sp. J367]|uniref:GNAT family N-acetyltransferase n=1 Tax=Phenylobacterium sp. J367 TaxID=2898435 RepID=UPI002151A1B5|nr:GNAT family N-acetyltransferase [Phenylobacterium sp. J367]MCR5878040.1 GNAT family N-acetyltransferase [Phenylobacterium sp. J367]